MPESVQKKLSRVRPPGVQITYDVEIGDAQQKRELPFVVGVLADLSGNAPRVPKASMKERKFVEVDSGTINEVMTKIGPGLSFKVANRLADDDSEIPVELAFDSMNDFEPAAIVEQVEPLKKLLETRNQLRDLLTRADRSEELEAILSSCLQDEAELGKLSSELDEAGLGKAEETTDDASDAPAEEGT